MAVAFDNAASAAGAAVSSLTTATWTIGGADRIIVGGMGWSAGAPPNYTSMKWEGSAGAAFTQVDTTLSAGFGKSAMARLIAPNATSGTLYGEISTTTDEFCIGGVSFTGVDQTTPLGTSASNTGTGATSPYSATVNVSSAAGEVVIDVCYSNDTNGNVETKTVVAGAGQTMRWERESVGTHPCAGTQSTEDGGVSVTMSEDFTSSQAGAVHEWTTRGVPIKPVSAAAGDASVKFLHFLF